MESTVKDFEGTIDGLGVKTAFTTLKGTKLPLHLVVPQFIVGVARVLMHGAKKYAPNNWMRGMSWEECLAGVNRHLLAFRCGEEMDPDSGIAHLFHAACGIMFLAWYSIGPNRRQYRQWDDRLFCEREEVQLPLVLSQGDGGG